MAKALKLWNGSGYGCKNHKDTRWDGIKDYGTVRAYIAAYSRADARRIIKEYSGYDLPDHEIKNYWNPNCWGNDMNGVTPERGLWLHFPKTDKPVKVL